MKVRIFSESEFQTLTFKKDTAQQTADWSGLPKKYKHRRRLVIFDLTSLNKRLCLRLYAYLFHDMYFLNSESLKMNDWSKRQYSYRIKKFRSCNLSTGVHLLLFPHKSQRSDTVNTLLRNKQRT